MSARAKTLFFSHKDTETRVELLLRDGMDKNMTFRSGYFVAVHTCVYCINDLLGWQCVRIKVLATLSCCRNLGVIHSEGDWRANEQRTRSRGNQCQQRGTPSRNVGGTAAVRCLFYCILIYFIRTNRTKSLNPQPCLCLCLCLDQDLGCPATVAEGTSAPTASAQPNAPLRSTCRAAVPFLCNFLSAEICLPQQATPGRNSLRAP